MSCKLLQVFPHSNRYDACHFIRLIVRNYDTDDEKKMRCDRLVGQFEKLYIMIQRRLNKHLFLSHCTMQIHSCFITILCDLQRFSSGAKCVLRQLDDVVIQVLVANLQKRN